MLLPPQRECKQNARPTVHWTATKPKRRLPPEVLTDAEVRGLIRACGRHAPTGLRNRALIVVLYRTGLRINEALSLFPKDFELAEGPIRVLHGKGGRSRTVGLDAAGNLKPSKKKSTERIDGIVAAIMALGRAMLQPEDSGSVYETRGLITL